MSIKQNRTSNSYAKKSKKNRDIFLRTKNLILYFIIFLSALGNQAFSQYFTPPTTYQNPEKKQKVENIRYEYNSGSGFFINNKNIITNAHVVDKCISIHGRGAIKPTPLKIIASEPRIDLAILESPKSPSRFANLKSNTKKSSSKNVAIIGYPLERGVSGNYLVKFADIIRIDSNNTFFLLSDVAKQGNSGGPVIDSSGNIIGVISGILEQQNFIEHTSTGKKELQNISRASVAIQVSTLRKFLEKNQINYQTDDNQTEHPSQWVENISKQFIVNIHCITNMKNE